ncbi:T9SS type A sorting domain-containing protein [Dyadobacter flavalbus]|uniref:T9SS type A sorting domain-containing protein n=1 Tax=Dyadobacter flavalbus TaxID=2579942 RepID=A0A5M8R1U0_9BACT|nr:T9SS type A sorting domain-containing protein [Dyadobacter flavalbus]KAA6440866.1 T9SS type A sorting domain-containing protein [Dyadobacter flavalbus]
MIIHIQDYFQMKNYFKIICITTLLVFGKHAFAQDVSLNILGQPDKLILGQTGYVKIELLNESLEGIAAPAGRLRSEITVSPNIEIVDVVNDDNSPLTSFGTLFKTSSTVILRYDKSLDPGENVIFHVLVKAITKAPLSTITSTLGFHNGPQTKGNHSGNDNSVTNIQTISEDPQPVTLVQFNVQKEGQHALLHWETSNEFNSERFDVQKSVDGKHWITFETVEAKGESKELSIYSAIDKEPYEGENLYRLHMIDKDGTNTYSKVRTLKFKFASSISVYPNPVSDFLNIDEWSTISKVSAVTADGRIVYNSGLQSIKTIDVRDWQSGIYILKIVKKDGSSSAQKVLVTK